MENRIFEFEKAKIFDKDVLDDPEGRLLKPDEVDYLQKKLSSKIKAGIANLFAVCYFENLIKKNELIIKEVTGQENYKEVAKSGVIVTSNHFHPFDNYAILKAIQKDMPHKRLYKIIKEGNYTSMTGLYGFFFRNCNTLPLSSSLETMRNFIKATSTLLKRGETILIYPEQSLWYNYKKPKPLKTGAFEIAVRNNVPVVPIFITLSDSEKMGNDGYFIQEYSIHILKAIYPDPSKSYKDNVEYMKNTNYEAFKDTYEKVYGVPLKYIGEE